jgi:uncharacterized protein DUF3175
MITHFQTFGPSGYLESVEMKNKFVFMASQKKSASKRNWSKEVTRSSNALDLDRDVFTWKDPKRIARSLKKSAENSTRRKAKPFQSAMSMLTFYVNRAGQKLPAAQKKILEKAKVELRALFQKTA